MPNFLETHTIFSVMRTDFTAATFLAHALNGYFVIYDVCMLALGCGMALPWRSKYLLKLPQLHHPVSRSFSSSYSSSRVDICFMSTDTFFRQIFFPIGIRWFQVRNILISICSSHSGRMVTSAGVCADVGGGAGGGAGTYNNNNI